MIRRITFFHLCILLRSPTNPHRMSTLSRPKRVSTMARSERQQPRRLSTNYVGSLGRMYRLKEPPSNLFSKVLYALPVMALAVVVAVVGLAAYVSQNGGMNFVFGTAIEYFLRKALDHRYQWIELPFYENFTNGCTKRQHAANDESIVKMTTFPIQLCTYSICASVCCSKHSPCNV